MICKAQGQLLFVVQPVASDDVYEPSIPPMFLTIQLSCCVHKAVKENDQTIPFRQPVTFTARESFQKDPFLSVLVFGGASMFVAPTEDCPLWFRNHGGFSWLNVTSTTIHVSGAKPYIGLLFVVPCDLCKGGETSTSKYATKSPVFSLSTSAML